ncbi:hypothetical protein NDU88_002181 [Pleurodeles waltl]|uniref:Uncharacterized protein n=1 Tax=Pleurodeles waltl TaxID=8319 RepID=A0AAV7UUT7_PLEWA|nr:hypothetical protein NDU88_002181 [Pleurodeles waltl]
MFYLAPSLNFQAAPSQDLTSEARALHSWRLPCCRARADSDYGECIKEALVRCVTTLPDTFQVAYEERSGPETQMSSYGRNTNHVE